MADGPESWTSATSGYWHMRASDADRERALDVLRAGFAEGRLSREELDIRQAQVLAARSCGELAALTADLPAGPIGTLVPAQPEHRFPMARKTNRLAIASLIAALVPAYGTVPAIVMGHAARRQIRASREGGARLAAVGLGIGYLTAGMLVLLFLMMSIR
jgi:DUF1707 SHOCT-like domain/Domain of unknown function (DUF4190)